MHRLRERWVALLGGALLVTLSVSTAFGADPIDETDGPRGQTIAGFVHSLIFTDDEPAEDEALLGDEDVAEDGLDETLVEDGEDELVEGDRASGAEHGACVAEIAASDEVGGVNENHGGAVSEAARVTCWEPEEGDEELTPEEDVDEESLETDSHGACVSEVARDPEAIGGPNENHGGAVSEAARETCREDAAEETTADEDADSEALSAKEQRRADHEAAKAARHAERVQAKAARTNHGGGRP